MADPLSLLGGSNDPLANRDSELFGGCVVLIVLPLFFVGLRLLSRWMARANLWWDDYASIVALILSWGPNIVNLIGSRLGLGKHLDTLSNDTIVHFFKYLYAFDILYVFASASTKFAIILFQYRIFPIAQHRRIMFVMGIYTTCLAISTLLVCIFQCTPVPEFWKSLAGHEPGAKCIDLIRFSVAAGSINAATDFILLALPIPLLWKLPTEPLQKIILTTMFGIGLLACSISIVRLLSFTFFSTDDITWTYVSTAIWTCAEPSVGVISACIPSLRPLFAKLIKGRDYRPKITSRSNSSHHLGCPRGWRSAKGSSRRSESLSRLQDDFSTSSEHQMLEDHPWRHKAYVRGGNGKDDKLDVNEMDHTDEEDAGQTIDGIRVKTTITITENITWLDDLY